MAMTNATVVELCRMLVDLRSTFVTRHQHKYSYVTNYRVTLLDESTAIVDPNNGLVLIHKSKDGKLSFEDLYMFQQEMENSLKSYALSELGDHV